MRLACSSSLLMRAWSSLGSRGAMWLADRVQVEEVPLLPHEEVDPLAPRRRGHWQRVLACLEPVALPRTVGVAH